jgi:hypothetical protein
LQTWHLSNRFVPSSASLSNAELFAHFRPSHLIQQLYITPLRTADPPVIGRDRLDRWIAEVFGNYKEILAVHRNLLHRLTKRQRDQHPVIGSVTDLIFDAILQWGDSYMNYAANYPIAKWKIDRELRNNPSFKEFFDVSFSSFLVLPSLSSFLTDPLSSYLSSTLAPCQQCTRKPRAHRKDMRDFINRPIPRLLRYDLLLKEVEKMTQKEGLPTDEIRGVMEELKVVAAQTDRAVEEAQVKIEMWSLKDSLTVPSEARFTDSVVCLEFRLPSFRAGSVQERTLTSLCARSLRSSTSTS